MCDTRHILHLVSRIFGKLITKAASDQRRSGLVSFAFVYFVSFVVSFSVLCRSVLLGSPDRVEDSPIHPFHDGNRFIH